MNGVSLLVAFAALGVDVGWENVDGQSIYTVRIESVLAERLRSGEEAVQTDLEGEARRARRFQVAMGPKQASSRQPRLATLNEVDYGWEINADGGVDYYIQVLPERLQLLATGTPLLCDVHPDVGDIDRLWVFVGTQKLPKAVLPTGQAAPQTPGRISDPSTRRDGTVAATSATQSKFGTPAFGGGGFNVGDTAGSVSTTTGQNGDRPWRSDARPATTNRTSTNLDPPRAGRPADTVGTRRPTTGGFPDRTIPVPSVPREEYQAPYGGFAGQGVAGGIRPQQPPPRQDYTTQQQHLTRQPSQAGWPAAAYPPQPPYPPTVQPTMAAASPQTEELTKAIEKLTELQLASAKRETPNDRSQSATTEDDGWAGTPLVLTTLFLFTSIAANAYLGWLAWSFFWRYRDAATEAARARTVATGRHQQVAA